MSKWPEPMEFALRELWPSGKSCPAIAAEMTRRFGVHVTKSMISGKRSRTDGLESRPTPIIHVGKIDAAARQRIQQLRADGLTQIEIAEAIGVSRDMVGRAARAARAAEAPPPKIETPTRYIAMAPAPIPATNVVAFPSVSCCQFPLWGHKERPKFGADGMPLFCNATTGDGPYCVVHKRKVYRQWNEVA